MVSKTVAIEIEDGMDIVVKARENIAKYEWQGPHPVPPPRRTKKVYGRESIRKVYFAEDGEEIPEELDDMVLHV